MINNIMRWLESQWYNTTFSVWHIVTWPFEQLFRGLSYAKRVRDRAQATGPCVPVIIVGNIHVGGMGKSPVVQALALAIAQRQKSVGVLLRGYKAKGTHQDWPMQVFPETSPDQVGDEPVMHSQAFQQYADRLAVKIITVVDPDRVRGAAYLQKLGVDIIICDDGLQHYRLQRDCEIVVMNGAKGTGRSNLLPTGPLRESLSRLLEVDLIMSPCGLTAQLMQQVPLVERHLWLYELHLEMPQPAWLGVKLLKKTHLCGSEPIKAVAGIAHPADFFTSLSTLGFLVHESIFADHHTYTLEDLQQLSQSELPVVVTGKDVVKIIALLQALNVLDAQFRIDTLKARDLHILNVCQRIHVLPYQAVLEEAVVDRVLQVALEKYQQRRQQMET